MCCCQGERGEAVQSTCSMLHSDPRASTSKAHIPTWDPGSRSWLPTVLGISPKCSPTRGIWQGRQPRLLLMLCLNTFSQNLMHCGNVQLFNQWWAMSAVFVFDPLQVTILHEAKSPVQYRCFDLLTLCSLSTKLPPPSLWVKLKLSKLIIYSSPRYMEACPSSD